MEANNTTPQRPAGCSLLLKSCLVTTVLVIALFMAGLIYMVRMTSVRDLSTCAEHMREVAAAVERYDDVNSHRPAKLAALRKEYLKDPSVLRCPLDKSPGERPSYAYNPEARDGQTMLECDRHRIRDDMPISKLKIHGDGTFEMVKPSLSETLKEAEKHAKEKGK